MQLLAAKNKERNNRLAENSQANILPAKNKSPISYSVVRSYGHILIASLLFVQIIALFLLATGTRLSEIENFHQSSLKQVEKIEKTKVWQSKILANIDVLALQCAGLLPPEDTLPALAWWQQYTCVVIKPPWRFYYFIEDLWENPCVNIVNSDYLAHYYRLTVYADNVPYVSDIHSMRTRPKNTRVFLSPIILQTTVVMPSVQKGACRDGDSAKRYITSGIQTLKKLN